MATASFGPPGPEQAPGRAQPYHHDAVSREANCGTERGSQKGCFVCGTDGSNPSQRGVRCEPDLVPAGYVWAASGTDVRGVVGPEKVALDRSARFVTVDLVEVVDQ
jgi:hypothetical protein